MKMGIIGFLMMQNSYLTIKNRSRDRKCLKMADFLYGRLIFDWILEIDIISDINKSIKLGIVGFLMMLNSFLGVS